VLLVGILPSLQNNIWVRMMTSRRGLRTMRWEAS
jgi:hypothetical protein